ncbi:hypothetical protein [Photobacterium galatheae]|uniref:Uncharacterized protein n=1 Tax=Photobacterium galatheae TaxID=1654360 RepID=A0A066RW17_9GAMM|nr:hypothetical protein [Photobacterium galatheae]KDM91573.1 hypothetical protein EA58_11150 [Photobacterium galatheae]MCM0149646.1 hypothetical protein [Photobacterium galatheae]
MRSSTPFPGQTDTMFKDKFHKWPKLMRYLVFISLLPSAILLVLAQTPSGRESDLLSPSLIVASINLILIGWGLILKIRARKYWYRNYHIGKTILIALLPLITSTYLVLNTHATSSATSTLPGQPVSRSVQLSIN